MTEHLMRILHVLVLVVQPIANAALAYYAWQKDRGVLGKWFVTNNVLTLGWGLTVLLQVLVEPLTVKVLLYQIKYVFQWATAIGWFVFALHYTEKDHLLTRNVTVVCASLFTVGVLIAVTNGTSGLLWSDFWISESPFRHLMIDRTIRFWPYLILGYTFVASATGLMLIRMTRSGRLSRQPLLVGVAFVIVLITDIITRLQLGPVQNFDYTVLSQVVFAGVLAYVIFREGLLEATPVTRDDVMRAVRDGIIAINGDRLIIDYNSQAKMIFPNLSNSTGDPIDDAVPELVDDSDSDQLFTDEITRNTKDGQKTFRVAADKLEGDRGWAITIRDVTEIKQYAKDLEQQTEQLDDFASVVAHDIRNPLTVAETYLMDLHHDVDDERVMTALDAINRIDGIIDDALTLAREGQALDERDWYRLAYIVDDAWGMCDTPEAELDNNVPDETRIHTDPDRLQTVFENLIRNSIEHGGDDVTVRVGLIDEGFYYEDTGDGIPEDKREDVFDKGVSGADGTGFGLAIVQSIVEAHGWNVSISESEEGGARFEITNIEALAEDTEQIAAAD